MNRGNLEMESKTFSTLGLCGRRLVGSYVLDLHDAGYNRGNDGWRVSRGTAYRRKDGMLFAHLGSSSGNGNTMSDPEWFTESLA